MKLYVCWTTEANFLGSRHPCGVAYQALQDAGHDPEVVKSYGWRRLPDVVNRSEGRREVKKLTGKFDVPVLVTDDDEVIHPAEAIVGWARHNPAEDADGESQKPGDESKAGAGKSQGD